MAHPLVKRYLIALDRHKWAGLAGFALVMGLAGMAALRPAPPPRYDSSGMLNYIPPPVTVSQTNTALQQQGQVFTEEALLSEYVVESVVQNLRQRQIETDAVTIRRNASVVINPRPQGQNDKDEKEVPGLRVLVSYEDANAEVAQTTTQLLMEAMVEQSRLVSNQQINSIIENLNRLLPKVSSELREAENNLERYIRVEGPTIQAAQDGQLVGAITGSQQQQRQIRLSLEAIAAQIRSLESRLGLSADQAYTSSALSADPIIADLRAKIYQNELQTQVLSKTLRSEHPTMVELRNQQEAFETLLQQRVSEVIGGNQLAAPLTSLDAIRQGSSLDPARQQLANTLVSLQTQRETLQQQLAALVDAEQQLRREYAVFPNKQLEQSRLEQQVILKRTFYDQIQAKLADVRLAAEETVGSLMISPQPLQTELESESDRNSLAILLVGGFVGLLVGGGLVLLLDSLDATFHTLPDLQGALRRLEVPVLGLLPLMPQDSDADELPLVLEPDSPYIEPYERFRGNLRRAGGASPLKIVLLTSTLSGEGKTVSAYNLAIASARAGKRTLLIEADLRSPSQAGAFKITVDPATSVEPLRYYSKSEFSLVPDIENLYVLPSPGPQRQAAAILESNEMRRMLEDARGRFDLVVIDTPPLSRYNDALLIEPHTQGLVLVTRPGYTEEGLLNEAIEQFIESEDIQFIGAIINGTDTPVLHPNSEPGIYFEEVLEESPYEGPGRGLIHLGK